MIMWACRTYGQEKANANPALALGRHESDVVPTFILTLNFTEGQGDFLADLAVNFASVEHPEQARQVAQTNCSA